MTQQPRVHWGWQVAVVFVLMASAACASGYAPAGVDVVVRRPPPQRVEVLSAAPATGYVWIRGHYAWQNGDYIWMPGRWEKPPETRYRHWVAGHWQRTRNGYFWVEGHWQ